MALDGVFLSLVKDEILSVAKNSKVEKIHQPSREELVMHLRTKAGKKQLLLSIRANSPRLHFTERAPKNPDVPPMFCMLMRKLLTNATLTDIRQSGLDRILYMDFDATNEIGDKVKIIVSIEIMATYSNILLINGDDGKIIDAIRRIDLSQSTVRQILPGFPYTCPPKQDKINITESSTDEIIERIKTFPGKPLSSAVLGTIQGISPLTSRELVMGCTETAVSETTEADFNILAEKIDNLRRIITTSDGSPYILKDSDGKPVDFSFFEIKQYSNKYIGEFKSSFSELLDEFYYEYDRLSRTRQRGQELVKLINSSISRVSKKISIQQSDLKKCADREKLRINAELINANLYRLEKGALYYDIENYYDNNKVMRIKADPSKTPAANAQKYFKDYRKSKTAEQLLVGFIAQGKQDLQYLETVADALDRAETQAEIDEIYSELALCGYIKNNRRKKRKQQKLLPPMSYCTSDGFRVLVGRNNMQNDNLSLKTAAKNDMWLHTQKFPGSHVIIVSDNREISDSAIVEAAEIAAYHSKAREAKLVPVDYTLVKNLKKPQGAPPGKVIYHVYYSVNVTPDREKVEKLAVNN